MKKLKNWGIMPRLILSAILPVFLMFLTIVLYSYYSRSAEVQQGLVDRGNLISSALAKSSEYAVVSGNTSDLSRTMYGLLMADKSISGILILNTNRELILQVPTTISFDAVNRLFDAPIKKEVLAVNAFGAGDLPHVSSSYGTGSQQEADTVGYVRVIMSPAIMLTKQRQHVLIESALAGITLLISAAFGVFLTLSLTKPMARAIAALQQIRGGDYVVSLQVTDGGEIGDLQSSVIETAESLHQYKNKMEDIVAVRTLALQVAHDAAIKSDAEKRRLIQSVNSAIEQERKSISIDIHDHLNATLIVTKIEARRILAVTAKCTCPYVEEINVKVHAIIESTAELYKMARDIIKRLRPEIIDTLGLCGAVGELVSYYDAGHPQCQFTFESFGDFSDLESNLEISSYRLIQEALSNVVKHAHASSCSVILSMQQEHGANALKIVIRDDGCGFNLEEIEPGIGLLGMRERVIGAGGEMEMATAPNAGTTTTVRLPVVLLHPLSVRSPSR